MNIQTLENIYPWIIRPLIVGAPMRVFSGPALATAVSGAGGIGFIGPGVRPSDLDGKLSRAKEILAQKTLSDNSGTRMKTEAEQLTPEQSRLPIGVGFQLFDGDLNVAAAAVRKHRPIAAWLFVPKNGQRDIDTWAKTIRQSSPGIQIWLQVGSVGEAIAAAESADAPEMLVLQGSDAGGHGLRRSAGIVSLLPEASDALRGSKVGLIAAGGIADGRGVAAALAMGAVGAVMGTRFLASREADIAQGYVRDILRTSDGGQTTVRTPLFDLLTGRDDWPEHYDGRAIVNKSVTDHQAGMSLGENTEKFAKALKMGDNGWGLEGRLTTYAGSAIGLIKEVESAEIILKRARADAKAALQQAVGYAQT